MDKGANVNAQNDKEETPLHFAARNNNKEVVDALIKAGANINVKDKDEKTPFDLTTNEEIKTLFQKAAESPDAGLIDEPSTDSKGVQEEDAGTEKKEKQEGDAKSESDIAEKGTGVSNGSQPTGPTQNNGGQPATSAEKGTDVATGSAQPIAPIEPAQTEEQPSSFFGSLFSILMKPFSLIASFFGGVFSWLFGSDEPIQSSSESDQPVVLEPPNSSGDHDII